jgi:esterase/lipase superfamily enzyme
MDDLWYLDRYREKAGRIVFCTGQGAWEEDAIADTRAMQDVLTAKGVDATFDYWGYDADHHWFWWARMLSHHLERLGV